jgi:hypothetical protein
LRRIFHGLIFARHEKPTAPDPLAQSSSGCRCRLRHFTSTWANRRHTNRPLHLPPLPYAYEALQPHIDAETMRIHHDKHHQAYITNANKLLADQPELSKLTPEELLKNLDKAPEGIRVGLRNNVGDISITASSGS